MSIENEKLERIKAALRLTVELSDKATKMPWAVIGGNRIVAVNVPHPFAPETPYRLGETFLSTAGIPNHIPESNASYIAQACNMGAPTAKAMLEAIEVIELRVRVSRYKSEVDALKQITNLFPDL